MHYRTVTGMLILGSSQCEVYLGPEFTGTPELFLNLRKPPLSQTNLLTLNWYQTGKSVRICQPRELQRHQPLDNGLDWLDCLD